MRTRSHRGYPGILRKMGLSIKGLLYIESTQSSAVVIALDFASDITKEMVFCCWGEEAHKRGLFGVRCISESMMVSITRCDLTFSETFKFHVGLVGCERKQPCCISSSTPFVNLKGVTSRPTRKSEGSASEEAPKCALAARRPHVRL